MLWWLTELQLVTTGWLKLQSASSLHIIMYTGWLKLQSASSLRIIMYTGWLKLQSASSLYIIMYTGWLKLQSASSLYIIMYTGWLKLQSASSLHVIMYTGWLKLQSASSLHTIMSTGWLKLQSSWVHSTSWCTLAGWSFSQAEFTAHHDVHWLVEASVKLSSQHIMMSTGWLKLQSNWVHSTSWCPLPGWSFSQAEFTAHYNVHWLKAVDDNVPGLTSSATLLWSFFVLFCLTVANL